MKKINVFALILAVVIICFSVNSAFAVTDAEKELYRKMNSLLNLCEEAHFAYGIGYSITEPVYPGSPIKPKYLNCSDTTELERAWEDACPMIKAYFYSHMFTYDGEISIETATAKYDTLHDELYKVAIDRSELELLVAFCEQESNDDGYYETQIWDDFQSEIAQSKELLGDEMIADSRMNTAYYELMYQLNLLCTCNQVPGDLDHDGRMSVMDATYVQRYVAEKTTVNFSQMLVTGNYKIDGMSIITATTIQRKCAKIIDRYNPDVLEMMIKDLEKSNPESEEFELSSWRNNFIYYYSTESAIR